MCLVDYFVFKLDIIHLYIIHSLKGVFLMLELQTVTENYAEEYTFFSNRKSCKPLKYYYIKYNSK